jgi:hypothetical protein
MSFIFTPSDASSVPLLVSNSFEAIASSAGVSVGDSITRRQIIDNTGAITATTFFNETTGLVVATAPAAANLVEIEDQTADLLASNIAFKTANPSNAISNNIVAGSLISEPVGRSISSLYVVNTAATVGHWVGVVSGTVPPVSGTTTLIASVWISGAANSQALLDQAYFNSFANQNGFQIVRSSTPLIYTQLGAVLANAQTIRVNSFNN